jgi:uncharacterized protein YrrD
MQEVSLTMKRANDIIKLPVISILEGEELGIVEDLLIDADNGKVEFLVVNDSEWYMGAKLIAFEDVKGIGVDVITTEKKQTLKPFSECQAAMDYAKRGIRIIGTKAYTETGVYMGVIDEIIVDEKNGVIYGCDLIRDKEKNKGKEKVIIPSKSVITYGKQVSIVVDHVEDTFVDEVLEEDVLKNKISLKTHEEEGSLEKETAKEEKTLGDDSTVEKFFEEESTKDSQTVKAQEEQGKPAEEQETNKTKETNEAIETIETIETIEAKEQIQKKDEKDQEKSDLLKLNNSIQKDKKADAGGVNLFRQRQKEFLMGRVCNKKIMGDRGEVLIEKGEIITEELFDKNVTTEKLTEITMNSR